MSNDDSEIIKSVLDELECERNRRAELEMELYSMRNKLESSCAIIEPLDLVNRNLRYKEEEKDDSPLIISHMMNILFEQHDSTYVQNRSLHTLLRKFFGDLYDSIMKYTEQSTKSLEDREKIITMATQKVVMGLEQTPQSRLIKSEYDIESVKIVLEEVAQGFCVQLNGKRTYNDENDNHPKMTAEINGLKELLKTMLSDNDAVLRSSQNESGTLPLFITRLLEILPWDDRIESYISAYEKVHQWQRFDLKNRCWADRIRMFPTEFISMPIHNLNTINDFGVTNVEPNQLKIPIKGIQHAIDTFGLSGRLLTNSSCDRILDLTNGYPLPESGTWEWVGNWSIDGFTNTSNCESLGWKYASDIQTLVNGGGSTVCEDSKVTPFRRRTWQRLRVLIAYPGISRGTEQMLKMHAHNAKLSLAVAKLQDQVNSMHNRLMEKDEELEKTLKESNEQMEIIQKFVNEKKSLASATNAFDSPTQVMDKYSDSQHRKPLLKLDDNVCDTSDGVIDMSIKSTDECMNEVSMDMNSQGSTNLEKSFIHGAMKLQLHPEHFIGSVISTFQKR